MANLWLVGGAVERAQWLGVSLALLLAVVFGVSALAGRDPLSKSTRLPRWPARREAARDRGEPPVDV